MVKYVLVHSGVKGMRWGVRKKRTSSGSASKGSGKSSTTRTSDGKNTTKTSADHERIKALKKKKASELSDEELRKIADRIRMEKAHDEINKSRKDRGRAFLGKVMVNVGNQVVAKITEQAASAIAKSLMSEIPGLNTK